MPMFRKDTPPEAEFRRELRCWLQDNMPTALRGRVVRPPPEELMPWYRALSRKGWIAPHWPKQYGGMGASLNEQIIMMEELARLGAPYLPTQGLNHVGPILIEFGTEAQKARHLPPILRGDVIWAQGYSEPGAGSDLASLSTSATRVDDHFVVRGQKIWQTWAHYADWMFTLVRTDRQAQPRHAGISFLLIDLHSPGIKVRPIRTIVGENEFSEVFLDDVVVPADNLVGQLNDGWRIANTLLGHERLAIANPQHALIAIDRIKTIAGASGMIVEPVFRDRLAAAEISVVTLAALFSHAVALTNLGHPLGAEASVLKIFASETLQRLTDLLVEAAGVHALAVDPIATPSGKIEIAAPFLQSRRATIYGGSSEIQRNVIARRVLKLPA
jgi:alkylation response protein AidB-like acyl-CoA dehydrogenase